MKNSVPDYMKQSLRTSKDVLECCLKDEKNLGIREINRKPGLNKSRVDRILLTLEEKGIVVIDPDTMNWRHSLNTE